MELISNTPDDEEIGREKMADEMTMEPIRQFEEGQTSASQMEKSWINVSLF